MQGLHRTAQSVTEIVLQLQFSQEKRSYPETEMWEMSVSGAMQLCNDGTAQVSEHWWVIQTSPVDQRCGLGMGMEEGTKGLWSNGLLQV